jgi:hypothetical protein
LRDSRVERIETGFRVSARLGFRELAAGLGVRARVGVGLGIAGTGKWLGISRTGIKRAGERIGLWFLGTGIRGLLGHAVHDGTVRLILGRAVGVDPGSLLDAVPVPVRGAARPGR